MRPTSIVCFLLFLSFIPAFSNLVRFPITKRQKQKRRSNTRFLNLNSFAGSMDISDYQNNEYIASIKIGSDSQEFNVLLDTGSCNLWVPDSSMAGQVSNTFSCSSSSTCQATSTQLSLDYGIGSVVGYQASDQVKLGDLTIPNFDMIVAETVNDLTGSEFDGLMGLGLGTNYNFPTVLESLKSNGLISVGTFSMYLGNDPTSTGSTTGEIIFGGYNPDYAASGFQYVSVSPASESIYWQTNLMAVGFGTSQNITSGSQPVIFDSGTSLILLSQEIFDSLVNAATAQGVFFSDESDMVTQTCDCSAQNLLPNLIFYFEGASFNISAQNYIIDGSDSCYLGVSVQTGDIDLDNPMILGDTFLNNYYAMYTADNNTVGFAIPAPIRGFPAWGIVLIVLGVLLLIALGVYIYRRKKRGKVSEQEYYAGAGIPIGGSYQY